MVGPPPSVSHRPRHGTSKYAWPRNHVVRQTASSARPSGPPGPCPASAARRRWPPPNRCWKTVANQGSPPSEPCAAVSSSNSRKLIVGGFSTSTLAPAFRQASAIAWCVPGGVHTWTRSGRASASIRATMG
jgi:hypothetical protein